jgi:sugar lactone lactonase YvrE
MKTKTLLALLALLLGAAGLRAQSISVLVAATNNLNEPFGVAVDPANNFYITDSGNNRVIVYTPSGSVTNLAGTPGLTGDDNGPGVLATFNDPQGIVYARGGVVIADSGNNLIRFIDANANVTTLAGIAGVSGTNDGPGATATFNFPTAVAADTNGNIFVSDLLSGSVRKIDTNNVVSTTATGFYRPSGIAVDGGGNIYVSDTGNNSIKLVSGGKTTRIAGSGTRNVTGDENALFGTNATFNGPTGLLWEPGTGLVVSDTGNGVLRLVATNTVFGGFSVSSYFSSPELGAPVGLGVDLYGNIVLADELFDNIDSVVFNSSESVPIDAPQIGTVILTTTALGPSAQLTPVTSEVFNNDVVVAIEQSDTTVETFYELNSSNVLNSAPTSANQPISYQNGQTTLPPSLVTSQGNGPVVTIYAVSIAPRTGRKPSAIVSSTYTFQVANTTILGTDPSQFSLTNITQEAEITYTTDGSNPTNSPTAQVYTPGSTLNILNGTNDVLFSVVATRSGYLASDITTQTFHFSDVQRSTIGFIHGFAAGPGATIMVPVTIKLNSSVTLHTLQFRVEVTPNGGAPTIPTTIQHIPMDTNNFVPTSITGTNVPLTTVYTTNAANGAIGTGIAIVYVGDIQFIVSGEVSVANVAIPIPGNAAIGATYSLAVVAPSATSDGFQAPAFLTAFNAVNITVTNTGYIVGDTAPGNYYNAGDFGNGNMDNADVNNAFYASLGALVPPSFTDVYDAMDAYPLDQPGLAGGDGAIRFLDWQVILNRSLGLDQQNWARGWAEGGVRTNVQVSGVGLDSSGNGGERGTPRKLTRSGSPVPPRAPGNVWYTEAQLGSIPPVNARPGSVSSIPVYVNIRPGYTLSGMQFRGAVTPENGGPFPTTIGFTPAPGIANFFALPSSILPANEFAVGWSLGAFTTPLSGSNLLGYVQVTVPPTAQAGQTYALHFSMSDGAPDLQTQYELEGVASYFTVGGATTGLASLTSDDWKIRFFGSVNNPNAADNADPDGDGVPNWAEFAAGTNPTNAASCLVLAATPVATGGTAITWLTAPGKTYLVEAAAQAAGPWSPLPGTVSGTGFLGGYTDASVTAASGTRFYRVQVTGQ